MTSNEFANYIQHSTYVSLLASRHPDLTKIEKYNVIFVVAWYECQKLIDFVFLLYYSCDYTLQRRGPGYLISYESELIRETERYSKF